MTQTIYNFEGIREVALAIAYDNGIIYRGFSEEDFLSKCDEIIGAEGVTYEDLKKIDDWILTLSKEQRSTLASGEYEDMVALESQFSDQDLLGIFNEFWEM